MLLTAALYHAIQAYLGLNDAGMLIAVRSFVLGLAFGVLLSVLYNLVTAVDVVPYMYMGGTEAEAVYGGYDRLVDRNPLRRRVRVAGTVTVLIYFESDPPEAVLEYFLFAQRRLVQNHLVPPPMNGEFCWMCMADARTAPCFQRPSCGA